MIVRSPTMCFDLLRALNFHFSGGPIVGGRGTPNTEEGPTSPCPAGPDA